MPGAVLLHQMDEQVGQRQAFGAQRAHATQRTGRQEGVHTTFQCRQAEDGLRAALVAGNACCRPIVGREFERCCVAPPA